MNVEKVLNDVCRGGFTETECKESTRIKYLNEYFFRYQRGGLTDYLCRLFLEQRANLHLICFLDIDFELYHPKLTTIMLL